MALLQEVLSYVRIALFGLIVVVALIYCIPILFLRRFHHRNNILTLNICIATALASLYWFLFYLKYELDLWGTLLFLLNNCQFSLIFPVMITLQVPFSFVTASINRLCAVVYHHRPLFKKPLWIFICIAVQWVLCTLLSLPLLGGIGMFCTSPRWHDIYKLMLIVVIPGFVFLVTNLLIFIRVRRSTLRTQPVFSQTGTNVDPTPIGHFSRRDLHLLRHMIVMISMFLGGWAPIYILLSIQSQFTIEPTLSASLTILCELALFFDIIDLYFYNRELRIFLKNLVIFC